IERIRERMESPVAQPPGIILEVIQLTMEYRSRRSFVGIGDLAVGYLSGGVEHLEGQLNKVNDEANEVFDTLLEETPEVTREMFQFPNWEPFKPYTEEDYEELE